MNAIGALNAHALHAHAPGQPPAPPVGTQPLRWGNGRVEIQLYPGATAADRLAGAATLLAGTGHGITATRRTDPPA